MFLTNIDSPPDELASALLQLGLKTAGESCTVRRPSLPQVNNLYHKSSYGVPDFPALLDCKLYCKIQLSHHNLNYAKYFSEYMGQKSHKYGVLHGAKSFQDLPDHHSKERSDIDNNRTMYAFCLFLCRYLYSALLTVEQRPGCCGVWRVHCGRYLSQDKDRTGTCL